MVHRSTRQIQLTAAGKRFYAQTVKLEDAIQLAEDSIKATNDRPFGELSITMPTSLGSSFTPLLTRQFQSTWPDINLHINLDDDYRDIIGEGHDVAIRLAKKLVSSALLSRRLMSSPQVLVASPGYLRKKGRPRHLEELRIHHCLAYTKRNLAWRCVGPEGPVTVKLENVTTFNNDLAMILSGVLDGGIILTPRISVENEIKQGRLEVILTKYRSKLDWGVFAVYPNRAMPASAKVFIDFVEAWLPRMGEIDRWDPLQLARKN